MRPFEPGETAPGNGAHGVPVAVREHSTYVRDLWNFLQRNRLTVLVVPLLVLAAALSGTRLVQPVFESNTTIRIDEDRSNVPVLDMLRTLSSGSSIGTEMQVLRSRVLLEAVVDSLRLQVRLAGSRGRNRDDLVAIARAERTLAPSRYQIRRQAEGVYEVQAGKGARPVTIRPGEMYRDELIEFMLLPAVRGEGSIRLDVDRHDDTMRRLRGQLVIGRPSRDADIVDVRYQSTDRRLVADVPNLLAAHFIALRNRDRVRETQSTIRFLEDQLGLIAAQLATAEGEVRTFRERSGLINIEAEARASISGLGELRAERDGLAAEAAALEQLVQEIADASEPVMLSRERHALAFPTLLRISTAAQLLSTLTELETERSQRLQRVRPTEPEIVLLDARIREVEQQVAAIVTTYLRGLRQQVASLDRTLARFRSDLQRMPAQELVFAQLSRETKVLEELYVFLQTRLKENEVLAAIEDGTVRVVDDAIVPNRPVRPHVPLTLMLALLVGSVLGVGVAYVREQLDTAVHTREDLQRAVPGLVLLGTIPRIRAAASPNGARRRAGAARSAAQSRVVAADDPQNPAAEAYRSLRTSIAFSRAGAPPRTLVVTSALPGDGKSTSAANLAVTLARQGTRCVLVDADLRRGIQAELFGVAREPGLSDLLLSRTTADDVLQQVETDGGTLFLLPSGVVPPNPAELLGSSRMAEVLAALSAKFDAVVMDAPPLNLVTDAALLGVHADGVLLVARAGSTDRGAIAYAAEQLHAVRARLLGAVLNDVGDGRERYYGSYLPNRQESVRS